MAIGSMTTNSTVDIIDKTLTIENVPADAKATGDALAEKVGKDVILDEDGNVIFYSKAAVDKLLAGKLGLHDMADNAEKWSGYSIRQEHNTSDTWIPVFSDDNVDYVLKSEISDLNGIATSGSGYTRFTDGTQICWELGIHVDGLPSETNKRVTFPVPFTVNPAILTTANANIDIDAIISIGWESTTGFSIGANSSEARGVTSWIAIGRWK